MLYPQHLYFLLRSLEAQARITVPNLVPGFSHYVDSMNLGCKSMQGSAVVRKSQRFFCLYLVTQIPLLQSQTFFVYFCTEGWPYLLSYTAVLSQFLHVAPDCKRTVVAGVLVFTSFSFPGFTSFTQYELPLLSCHFINGLKILLDISFENISPSLIYFIYFS